MPILTPLARRALVNVKSYVPGKPIEEVRREFKLHRVIKLASNESALGPSPKAVAAMRKALNQAHRYPDAGCYYLKQKLARKLRVPCESLLIGNGSDEVLVLALRAFVEPGDEVIIAQPTFLIYDTAATACNATVVRVPLKDMRYDLAAMKRAITGRTRLIFIANPDNPTGTYVTHVEVEAFLQGLPKQVVVVVDEAYHEFVEAPDYPNALMLLRKHPLIVTRSFSKAYGLAGVRVGYGAAQPALIEAMERCREPFNVNSIAQAAATAALDDKHFLKHHRKLIRKERPYLCKKFERLGLRYIPSVTNFVLVELGPRAPQVAQQLLRAGVIVREMTAWGLDHYLRVTIGTHEENRKFVYTLRRLLNHREN